MIILALSALGWAVVFAIIAVLVLPFDGELSFGASTVMVSLLLLAWWAVTP